jgi:hypothetical protein
MEAKMNEDVFNTSIRKFLKRLGVTAQREIENAVRQGLEEGKLKGNERLPAEATVTLGAIGLSLESRARSTSTSRFDPWPLQSGQQFGA